MTPESFTKTLEEFLEFKPFQIFSVVMNTGQRFQVDHPKAVTYRDGVAVFVAPGGHLKIFDHDSVNQFTVERTPAL